MFFAQGMYDELQNFSHFPGPVEKNHWLLLYLERNEGNIFTYFNIKLVIIILKAVILFNSIISYFNVSALS